MKSLYGPLTLLAGLAMISTAPFAADKIGVTAAITNEVTSTIHGDTGEVASGDGVFQSQTFDTAQDSRAQLLFIDETVLTIEAGSSVAVEVFEYDFDSNAGKMTLSTTEGAFQLIMGLADPSSYTIKTPVAIARGRDAIIVWRFGDGKLTTVLMQGVADVCNSAGDCIALERPATYVVTDGSDFSEIERWEDKAGSTALDAVLDHISHPLYQAFLDGRAPVLLQTLPKTP